MWRASRCFVLIISLCLVILMIVSDVHCDSDVINAKQINNFSDYDQFLDDDFARFPKCCPPNSLLIQTADLTDCSSSYKNYQHIEISAVDYLQSFNSSNFTDNCEVVDCVDFLFNNTESSYDEESEWHLVRMHNCMIKTIFRQYAQFPKCCPRNFAYNTKQHNCVQQNENVFAFNKSLQVLNISLSHCPSVNYAIADFEEDFTVQEDKSITLASGKSFKFSSYCIDENAESGKNVIRACMRFEDACNVNKRRCFKKCCPDGEAYIKTNANPRCKTHYTTGLNITNSPYINKSDDYNFGITGVGPGKRYPTKPKHKFFINENGNFHVYENNQLKKYEPKDTIYCIESYLTSETSAPNQMFFMFIAENPYKYIQDLKFYLQGCILALSCICLFITIICYLVLPETQNSHGKSILMFCVFLFLGDLTLCFIQINGSGVPHHLCVTIGFTIMFTFLGTFSWMNVICFDMWMAFGTLRVIDVKNKRKEMKKLIYYSLYGWGIPITICGFALLVYNIDCLPEEFVPKIGLSKCYFTSSGYDHFLYFIIPEAIMIFINCGLFVKTAIYCIKVKNEILRMRTIGNENDKDKRKKRYQADKEKLSMLLKLFLIMGVAWSFEVISSFFSFKDNLALAIIELIWDAVNCAEGIIIFCIFILKKKVLVSIKKQLGLVSIQDRRKSVTSTTAVTSITGTGRNVVENDRNFL